MCKISQKSYERALMKLSGGMGRGPKTNRSDFGGDPNLDADPVFLDADQGPNTGFGSGNS